MPPALPGTISFPPWMHGLGTLRSTHTGGAFRQIRCYGVASLPPVPYEKRRTSRGPVASGESVRGFSSPRGGAAHHEGAAALVELLNDEAGFSRSRSRRSAAPGTVLHNRSHVITVAVFDDESRRDPGYDVAARRPISLLLTNGRRVEGIVRIYRPEGRDRVSDWTRQPETFRYIESDSATFIVNVAHVVTVTEVPAS